MKQILVVDDETDVAETIHDIIDTDGNYRSHFVTNAKEAIELIKKNSYDLVITDLIMPDMNGIELVDYIFHNHPEVKVLACSGGGQSGPLVAGIALDQALEEGADNALLKPFSPEELMAKIANLID